MAIAKFVNTTLTDALTKLIELISNTNLDNILANDTIALKDALNLIKEDGNAEILKNVFQMSTIQKASENIKE